MPTLVLILISLLVPFMQATTWEDIRTMIRRADGYPKDKARQEKILREAYAKAIELATAKPDGSMERLWLSNAAGRLAQISSTKEKLELSKVVKREAEYAIKLDPKNGPAYMTLGAWHYYVADLSWIEKSAAKLIYGGLPPASYKTAEEMLALAIQFGVDNPIETHVIRAMALEELNRDDEARAEYRACLPLKANTAREREFKQQATEALE